MGGKNSFQTGLHICQSTVSDIGKLLCTPVRPRMDLCGPPCPSDTRGLACTPLVGPRGTGAAGGTSQRWDLGVRLLPSFGAVEMRCCTLAHPALRPALRLLAWQGTALVLAVFSAVPCAACLRSPSSRVHSTPASFLTEVLQGIMFEPGDLNTRCSLKHLQKLCPLSPGCWRCLQLAPDILALGI